MGEMIKNGAPVSYILLFILIYVVAVFFFQFSYFRTRRKSMIKEGKTKIKTRFPLEKELDNFVFNELSEYSIVLFLPGLKKIERQQKFLRLIVNAAPLLGLLGTVMGMIRSTHGILMQDNARLLEGISQSLITTALGLCVSIPSLFVLFFSRAKVEHIATDVRESFLENEA